MADNETAYAGVAENHTPRANESDLWAWLENLAAESDRIRRDDARFDSFDSYLDLYYGRHWPSTMPSYKPPIVVNELRTLILSEASDLTDNQFRMYVLKDPKGGGRDEEVERAIRAVWIREQVDLKLINAICWSLIVGTGFLRVVWDPDAANGLGDVRIMDVDPRFVLPDPDAIDDRDWQYVMLETVLDLNVIRRTFPLTGKYVKPEDEWSIKQGRSGHTPDSIKWASYSGPLTNTSSLVGASDLGYKKARARVLDCLIIDDTMETKLQPVLDDQGLPTVNAGGEIVYEEQRYAKYPKGRRIVGCNGIILYDGANPNPNGDFGILRVALEPCLGQFWGKGFAQQTGELQMTADKLMSEVAENAIRLNAGMVVATTNTGLDMESFANLPAQIIQINPGSSFDIKYPPPMPPDMIQAPWRMLDMQRRLLGFPDARSGNSSKGNTSAEMGETDISQSQGPTRLRSRMLYYTVQRLVDMIFARMASGYVTPRVIPAVEGESFKPVTWTPIDRPERYNTYVDPASFQVMSRTMVKRLGLALYRLHAIDRKSLLESIGWPDWQATSERLDQAEALMAQAKMKSKGKYSQ